MLLRHNWLGLEIVGFDPKNFEQSPKISKIFNKIPMCTNFKKSKMSMKNL